jgi:hypothetical protein
MESRVGRRKTLSALTVERTATLRANIKVPRKAEKAALTCPMKGCSLGVIFVPIPQSSSAEPSEFESRFRLGKSSKRLGSYLSCLKQCKGTTGPRENLRISLLGKSTFLFM